MHVLVTGGANGIGRATVDRLRAKNHDVTVLDYDGKTLRDLPTDVATIQCDVRDEDAVNAALHDVSCDVVVNCAGLQMQGAVEDMEFSAIRAQFETNVYGLLHVTRAVLPRLRNSGGRIINVSSIGGRLVGPYWGVYCATKHAVEGVSDALRMELRDTPVEVVVVEPGPIATGFNEHGRQHLATFLPDTRHADRYESLLAANDVTRPTGWTADDAAKVVVHAVTTRRPKPRYTAPRYLWPVLALKAVLPDRVWDWLAVRF